MSGKKNVGEIYLKQELQDHIYSTPDTYVGGADMIEETLPIFVDEETVAWKKIEYIPALYKIYDEIIVNARDQVVRLEQEGSEYPVTSIKISIDESSGKISVYNDGLGIDIVEHPTEKDKKGKPIMIPELIFGHLLTSTNYDGEGQKQKKIVGGKNGYGAKLTNIFSVEFKIETVDVVRGLKYVQSFSNNMKEKKRPSVTKFTGKPYTRITWTADFGRFGITNYSKDMIGLMKRRVYDISGVTDKKVSVYYNNEKIKMKTFEKYMNLYLKEDKRVFCQIHERWELGLTLSKNDKFEQISFVNGIATTKGGKHIDYITKILVNKITDLIQKKNKDKKKINENYIKNYLRVFVNATIENPSFDSQAKERLITAPGKFGSKPDIPDKFIKLFVEKCGIIEKVLLFAEFKESKEAKKTDGSKKTKINIPKLDDANWAGTKKSEQCTLILTEGDSAKSMAISGLAVIGRDKYGVFPLKGKVLNVKDASTKQMIDNAELTNLKKILGLQMNKEYKDTKSLRYGKIMIMTDQDHDGSHIKGLVLNLFHTLWPSLLKLNYITSMITPIVKVSKGKKVKAFYNLTDYHEWTEKTSDYKKWNSKYYKGLGTSTANEAKEYFRDMKLNDYLWTDETDPSMNLAFKKTNADERKTWLYGYDEKIILKSDEKQIHIEDFVHKELIHFSNSDTFRSIGSICDGLKPSQRKILYSCIKRNLKSEIRVAQLAGYVSENAAYHHGEASLQGAIIGMAQNFVGSNNINLLMPNGQFGTRLMGGSDSASPRYIHTELNKLVDIIFPSSDLPLLEYTEDDGLKVEPKYYVPILPMVLINGMTGIGTGFSTNIPQYNPVDIVQNLKQKLSGKEYTEMTPWFKGFEGTIVKKDDKSYITKGSYKITNQNTLEITELPIGKWTEDYKAHLESMMIERASKDDKEAKKKKKKQIILDYENHCTDSKVKFIVHIKPGYLGKSQWSEDEIDTIEKDFNLTTSKNTSLSNIHLYNHKGSIQKYETVNDILDEYFYVRYNLYEKRKDHEVNELKTKVALISAKCKFILDIIDENIIIFRKSKAYIKSKLFVKKYPGYSTEHKIIPVQELVLENITNEYNYLVNMPIYTFTKEEIDKLMKEKEDLENELTVLMNKTIKEIWLDELKLFEKNYKKLQGDN